jgi:glycosyltransferase involved in cell wall biosynthesis
MRIVIDMQGAQTDSRFRGIGRYTVSLAQAIARNRGEHEIILALNGLFPDSIEPIRNAFDGILPQENIRVWYTPQLDHESSSLKTWRDGVAECIREAFLASLQPDVVHICSVFEGFADDAVISIGKFAPGIPTSVTLHDLIPLLNPQTYLKPHPVYKRHYQSKIEHLKRANLWLAISESSSREGRDALELPANAVVSVSNACDAVFRCLDIAEPEQRRLLAQYGIRRPFILYSGGADQRKNLRRLILAYAQLPKPLREAHQLVLVGKFADHEVAKLRRSAKSAGVHQGQLLFTGYVTDEELAMLYNLCAVFVLPSLHEGFGLPALEAMSCGAAVIGANTTSVPEVIGRQDALFDPYDETDICRKLGQVLGDAAFRAALSAYGLVQAGKFSWDESALKAIAAFEKLYSAGPEYSKIGNRANILPDLINAIAAITPSGISDWDALNIAHVLSCIHTDSAPRQLLVDISELAQHDAGTGIQRVTRSILKELLETPPEGYVVEPVCAINGEPGYRYARHFGAQLRGTTANDLHDEPIDFRPGDIFLGLDLQHSVVASARKEYLHTLNRVGVRTFFVVYDLLPFLMPQVFHPHMYLAHKTWLETLADFDGAVCISRAVAAELTEWQRTHKPKRLRPFKVGWFHLGADLENSVPTKGLPDDSKYVLQELARRRNFLLVGTVEPRKGQAQVLSAFDLLWQEGRDANLVIVGRQGWMVDDLAKKLRSHPELNRRLFWLEGISDEYLELVYASSTCLISASEGEGFGLPLIEAAQHKLPIIARDIAVFREVAGEHAYYFNGTAPGDLAQSIIDWLQLYEAGQHPRSDNLPWLTWKQSARQLLKQILPESQPTKAST